MWKSMVEVLTCHKMYFHLRKGVDREARHPFLQHQNDTHRQWDGHGEGLGDLRQEREGSSSRSKMGEEARGSRRADASLVVGSLFGWGWGYAGGRGNRAVARARQEVEVGERGLRSDHSRALKQEEGLCMCREYREHHEHRGPPIYVVGLQVRNDPCLQQRPSWPVDP